MARPLRLPRRDSSRLCGEEAPVTGTIIQINVSWGGLPKRAIPEGLLTPLGLESDSCAHPQIHGGPDKAALLISAETIEELIGKGYPIYYGALGENFTTRGLDRRQMRLGQQYRVGGALIELTKVRGPCSTLDVYGPAIKQEIYDPQVKAGDSNSPRWGMSGFYARVLRPGLVRTNDIISLVAALA
jgi:MOSC domain-containing protein YiiM